MWFFLSFPRKGGTSTFFLGPKTWRVLGGAKKFMSNKNILLFSPLLEFQRTQHKSGKTKSTQAFTFRSGFTWDDTGSLPGDPEFVPGTIQVFSLFNSASPMYLSLGHMEGRWQQTKYVLLAYVPSLPIWKKHPSAIFCNHLQIALGTVRICSCNSRFGQLCSSCSCTCPFLTGNCFCLYIGVRKVM